MSPLGTEAGLAKKTMNTNLHLAWKGRNCPETHNAASKVYLVAQVVFDELSIDCLNKYEKNDIKVVSHLVTSTGTPLCGADFGCTSWELEDTKVKFQFQFSYQNIWTKKPEYFPHGTLQVKLEVSLMAKKTKPV